MPDYLGSWIKSYLSTRTFKVKLNGKFSQVKIIQAGVPQGSILGPLLFNIYFNTISVAILKNKYAKLAMFADDVAIWVASPFIKIINKQLQLIMGEIEEWMNKWRMVVSTNKTVVTLFNRNASKKVKLEIMYKGKNIRTDHYPKFLGVYLDPGLNFQHNTNAILLRANRRLNMLKRLKGRNWGLSSSLLIITYKVLIRSIFDYSAITFSLLSSTTINKT